MSQDDPIDLSSLRIEPPNPTYVGIAATLIRGTLYFLSGMGIGWAKFVSGDQITMIAFGVVGILTFYWSVWNVVRTKLKTRQRVAAAAILSAQAGRPVNSSGVDFSC